MDEIWGKGLTSKINMGLEYKKAISDSISYGVQNLY